MRYFLIASFTLMWLQMIELSLPTFFSGLTNYHPNTVLKANVPLSFLGNTSSGPKFFERFALITNLISIFDAFGKQSDIVLKYSHFLVFSLIRTSSKAPYLCCMCQVDLSV